MLSPSKSFSLRPVLWLATALAVGIGIGSFVELSLQTSAGTSGALCIAALLIRKHWSATLFVLAAFTMAGVTLAIAERQRVRSDRVKLLYDTGELISGEPVEVEGVMITGPEPSVDGYFLTLETTRLRSRKQDREVSGRIRLFAPHSQVYESPLVKYGSRILVSCALSREDQYLNPGVLRRPEYLDQIGIDATGTVKSPLLIEHLADESVFLPLAWVYDQRTGLIETFTSELRPDAAGVMAASLLGDKYFLDADTADVFREGGTFHVLVISGLHITFIGGILLLIVRSLTRNRWVQFAVTITVLWAYTLAVGAEVPVVRAAVMFTIVLFSYAIYRRSDMLNSLGLCGLILLVWRPADLFSPSFHLTFVSVAAIVAVAYPLIDTMRRIGSWWPTSQAPFPPAVSEPLRRLCETLYWDRDAWEFESNRQIWSGSIFKSPYFSGRLTGLPQKAVRYIIEGVIVSIAVQICMLPLLVIYFHRISVASILLNLWVGFFIALESVAAVLAALLSNVSSLLGTPLFLLADVLNWLMMFAPRVITDTSWSGFRLPAYVGAGRSFYVLFFAVLIALTYVLNRWNPWRPSASKGTQWFVLSLASLLLTLLFVVIFHPFSAPSPDGRLRVDFLDVGQGDAAFVTFPDGRTMLVDGGGRMRFRRGGDDEPEPFEPDVRRIGEAVVSEFLWERGYSRIDYVLATHADADHMQGLVDVAINLGIGAALLSHESLGNPEYEPLRNVLDRSQIPSILLSAGDSWSVGDVTISVLNPAAGTDGHSRSSNDSSVVIRLTYGDRSFLLTGDIESPAEADLISSATHLTAAVVKVPHHGSRTSSTVPFVASVKPQIAVIPVGRRSPFGHPHPEVVDRWRAVGADVRTTSEKGMITLSTDGKDLLVSTFLP